MPRISFYWYGEIVDKEDHFYTKANTEFHPRGNIPVSRDILPAKGKQFTPHQRNTQKQPLTNPIIG